MVGFIEPVGTSFQSARADRRELTTRSIRRKILISLKIFFLFMPWAVTSGTFDRVERFDGAALVPLDFADMSRQTSVHDLERLVQSFHSLIAVETVEEERVRSILMEVATRLNVPLYEWSLHAGLNRRISGELEGTKDPLSML